MNRNHYQEGDEKVTELVGGAREEGKKVRDTVENPIVVGDLVSSTQASYEVKCLQPKQSPDLEVMCWDVAM